METSVRREKQVFKQINISNEEVSQKYIIQATELSPSQTSEVKSANNLDKKVTVDESQNRIHLFVEDIDVEEDNGFMSKFKVATNPVPTDEKVDVDDNTDVYQELRQQQRKQQQQYQDLLLKMDDLSKKMDLVIQLVRERSS